jgi:hypothetical protein
MRFMQAIAEYKPTKWEEKPYESISQDRKLTKVSATFLFTGQMDGTASVEYMMFYDHFDAENPHASSASYIGLIRFQGRIGGKTGSFVMEDKGEFKAGMANSVVKIIPRSASDELQGIAGSGKYSASPNGCQFEINYDLK